MVDTAAEDIRITFGAEVTDSHENLLPSKLNGQLRSVALRDAITAGTYECTICVDNITDIVPIWSCKQCYHVYHIACVANWATGANRRKWLCPTCNAVYNEVPQARCWCGKLGYDEIQNQGNTCGNACGKVMKCDSPNVKCVTQCSAFCHPGPCDPECHPLCVEARTPRDLTHVTSFIPGKADQLLAQCSSSLRRSISGASVQRGDVVDRNLVEENHPSALQRGWRRWRAVEGREKKKVIRLLGVLMFIQILSHIWAAYHIKWWTRPLEHLNFARNFRDDEETFICAFSIVAGIISLILSTFGLWTLRKIVFTVFNLKSPRDIPFTISGKKIFMRFGFYLLWLAVTFSSVAIFPLCITVGTNEVWYQNMKNSCAGFDTRVKLDHRSSLNFEDGYDHPWTPATNFTLYNPLIPSMAVPGVGILELSFINSTSNSTADFQKHYRISGPLQSQELAIDFDLTNRKWRILEIVPHTSASTNSTKVEKLVRNGTWSNSSKISRDQSHIVLPELNLEIPDLAYFMDSCHYQSFMKVYRTAGLKPEELKDQRLRKWSPQSEDNVVMRTASFGHGYQSLELCAKRNDYMTKGHGAGVAKRKGLGDDIVIPLGLMAAIRSQMYHVGKLKDTCSMSHT